MPKHAGTPARAGDDPLGHLSPSEMTKEDDERLAEELAEFEALFNQK